MSKTTAQYHPRHQWIDAAAVAYHLERSKDAGTRDEELIDSLRSEIFSGLSEYFRSLNATKKTQGIHDPEDYAHDLLVSAMGDKGWLEQFDVTMERPFLGFVALMAEGGATHTTRKELPGSGRTQDMTRKFKKERGKLIAEHPEKDLDEISEEVLNMMTGSCGLGMEQIRNIRVNCEIKFVGTEDPIGEGITIGDTLAFEEDPDEINLIDRTTLQIRLERMPPRYRRILDSMVVSRVEGLHEIDFGVPLTLAEKAILFDTAIRIGQERTNRLPVLT